MGQGLSKWLSRPFTPSTGVQIPLGTPTGNQGTCSDAGAFFSCLCCGTRIKRCGNLSRRGVLAKAATPLFASTHYIFCLYIRQPASTENRIHENGLSTISGIHIPAYSPLPDSCSQESTLLYHTISARPFAEDWYHASPAYRTSALQEH